jgi:hypothetical protein
MMIACGRAQINPRSGEVLVRLVPRQGRLTMPATKVVRREQKPQIISRQGFRLMALEMRNARRWYNQPWLGQLVFWRCSWTLAGSQAGSAARLKIKNNPCRLMI